MEKCQKGNSLAAYSTASPVLNGGDEETGLVRPRLVATQLECGTCIPSRDVREMRGTPLRIVEWASPWWQRVVPVRA